MTNMEKLITAFRNAAKMNQMAQAVRESLTEGTMKITDIRGERVWFGTEVPTFRKNLPPSSPGQENILSL